MAERVFTIKEYIESHTLDPNDLESPSIRQEIARQIARIQSIELPFGKKPFDLFGLILTKHERFAKIKSQWLKHPTVLNEGTKFDSNGLANFDFPSEIEWYRKIQPKIKAPIVLSLRDMHHMNVLVRDHPNENGLRVTLIDYEYASMYYRGYDLGAHFVCWMTDMGAINSGFLSNMDFPTDDIQREYAIAYLDETSKLRPLDANVDNVEQILLESHFYGSLMMLLSFAWMMDPGMSCIDHEYAVEFMKMSCHLMNKYVERKSTFMTRYKDIVD